MTDINLLFFILAMFTFMGGGFTFLFRAINNIRTEMKEDMNVLRTEIKEDMNVMKEDMNVMRAMLLQHGEDISEIRGILVGAGIASIDSVARSKNKLKYKKKSVPTS